MSERQTLLKELDTLLFWLAVTGNDKTVQFKELFDLKGAISATRYLNLRVHLEKNRSMHDMLFRVSDRDFKQWVRMEKPNFQKLVNLISGHPVFYHDKVGGVPGHFKHRHKQAPVWIQLMVVLSKLGSDGNSNSIK